MTSGLGLRSSPLQVTLSKSRLRREFSQKRAALNKIAVLENSRKIAGNLYSLKAFAESQNILFYLSLEKEVQTDAMIARSFELGKKVYVPSVDNESYGLRITELPGLDIEFETGTYGIREPGKQYRHFVSAARIDFVVVPGLVFDRQGGRVGFGGGYYDRLLKKLSPRAVTAGVAFDFQVVESIPLAPHDVKVRKIITEKKTIDC
ncbi:MAG: 5-formyltetrahydrofolate cyclo-ligase [Nitrospinales bacterium]